MWHVPALQQAGINPGYDVTDIEMSEHPVAHIKADLEAKGGK